MGSAAQRLSGEGVDRASVTIGNPMADDHPDQGSGLNIDINVCE